RTFAPQAQRDRDALDIGYHYDPLDYIFKDSVITNTTVQFLPGTAVGMAGATGLWVQTTSTVISQGSPTSLNRIAWYHAVQEQSQTNCGTSGNRMFDAWSGYTGLNVYAFRFTDWSAQNSYPFFDLWNNVAPPTVSFSHCQFHGGEIDIYHNGVALTNCVLDR